MDRSIVDDVTSEPTHLQATFGAVHRNVQRFRGGLVLKAHRLCVSLNSRLQSNEEEEEEEVGARQRGPLDCRRRDIGTHTPAERESSLLATYWSEST